MMGRTGIVIATPLTTSTWLDLPDGAGGTEIWEHLSERRNGTDAETPKPNQD